MTDNLIGKIFGKLTVIKRINSTKRGIIYLCKCSCGNEKELLSVDLRRTVNAIKSCGCLTRRKRENHPNFKGCGEISLWFWNSIIRGAKRRNININITIEEAWDLFLKQNRRCALSGLEIKMRSGVRTKDGTASLDRINNKGDYNINNIQWVHKDINRMKHTMTQNTFINLCCEVAKIYGEK